jgi:uncharacterized iron-regulated membrane protein
MSAQGTSTAPAEPSRLRLHAALWRWHFFAALLVIPFVLWQSTTGTIYLWAEWWIDRQHPELRFVQPEATRALPSVQLAAALEAAPRTFAGKVTSDHDHGGRAHDRGAMKEQGGPPVQEMILSDDPRRSTTVLLMNDSGLPYPLFVDPYSGRVLGSLTAVQWLPGLTRALHGGWPLGKPGSWLLELADGWAIFMIVSGLYLWWPRHRGFVAALIPRFDRGARLLMRDLHSVVAVLFSAVFLFFLVSALPWTAFWGGEVLSRVQTALGQKSSAGFSPGGASARQMASVRKPIDELVAEARARGFTQALSVRLAPWPGAPLYLSNRNGPPSSDRVLLADPGTGAVTRDALRSDQPLIPRLVGFGIHVHQGDFGLWNLWMNTAFAASLVWLTVTGVASWWLRRPKASLGVPRKVELRWPRALVATAAAMCVLFPIFGASVLLVLAVERLAGSRWRRA